MAKTKVSPGMVLKEVPRAAGKVLGYTHGVTMARQLGEELRKKKKVKKDMGSMVAGKMVKRKRMIEKEISNY